MLEPPKKHLNVFFGHHKCATGWITGVIREVCFHLGWRLRIVHRPVEFAEYGSLGRLVEAEKPDFLAYTNADRNYINDLPPFRGVHVIRDPRDIIVSGYFSHRNSHPTKEWPELEAHREQLKHASKEEGLFLEMKFSRQRLLDMGTWDYAHPNILELTMEHLTAEPIETFAHIFEFLGILDYSEQDMTRQLLRNLVMKLNVLNQRGRRFTPFHMPISPLRFPLKNVSEEVVEAAIRRKSFERLSGGRTQGQENVNSHYRKGKAGDWQNHFTPEHAAYFEKEFGNILIKLGYESDASWVASAMA